MCVFSGLIGPSMLLLQWFCLFVFRLPDFHGANRRQWLKSTLYRQTGLKRWDRGRDPVPSLRLGLWVELPPWSAHRTLLVLTVTGPCWPRAPLGELQDSRSRIHTGISFF